ncbi:fimbrial protein [Salmonella enterica]|nr:fimbrial protein [Salmonella enterica]EMB3200866.1 fimbrial protein [Salmonella enterica]
MLITAQVCATEDIKTLMLTMNVRAATCTTATVTEAAFNRQSASDILAGAVSQPATLSIDCSAGGSAPDALTLTLIPLRPHATQGQDGYIRVVGRDDVGYHLLWGDNNVGMKGDSVPMNTPQSVRNPVQSVNDIQFDVKPVALDGATTIAPGDASTSVTIRVTYA